MKKSRFNIINNLSKLSNVYTDLNKAAFRIGVAYLSMEVIRQYFFEEIEQEKVSAEDIKEIKKKQDAKE